MRKVQEVQSETIDPYGRNSHTPRATLFSRWGKSEWRAGTAKIKNIDEL